MLVLVLTYNNYFTFIEFLFNLGGEEEPQPCMDQAQCA